MNTKEWYRAHLRWAVMVDATAFQQALKIGRREESTRMEGRRWVEKRTRYVVDEIRLVSPGGVSVHRPRPRSSITLMTCYPCYFSFWRNAGMGGYPGLLRAKIYLFSYKCITNGVGGPIAAKLCADVTVTWIRTEKLLGGVISLGTRLLRVAPLHAFGLGKGSRRRRKISGRT
jgi:hypothetical protein